MDRVEERKKQTATMAEPFVPKEEYTKLTFDPNIRHRMDEMPN